MKKMGTGETLRAVQVNGVLLHYFEAGTGKTVVLAHGNGESHHLFDTEIRQLLEAGYRVIAPDSRGHGANEPMNEYHYADMAEDMAQLIGALGLSRPAFYGHSDGGIIGLMLELRHPGTLSLLAASGVNLSPAGIEPSFMAEYAALNRVRPDPLITLMLTEPDIDPVSLEEIAIPVLVTAGERDLILPEETQKLVRHLRHAELIVVPGEDHGSYIDGSGIMGRLLIRFLERHGYTNA